MNKVSNGLILKTLVIFQTILCGEIAAQVEVGRIPGNKYLDELGDIVVVISDVNDDGFSDISVGSPGNYISGAESGSIRILSGIDGRLLYRLNGTTSLERFGSQIVPVSDKDEDGVNDLLIGIAGLGGEIVSARGGVRCVSGRTGNTIFEIAGMNPGAMIKLIPEETQDFNADNVNDFGIISWTGKYIQLRSGLNGELIRAISLADYQLGIGQDYPAFISDQDGDLFPDLLIGMPLNNPDAVILSSGNGTRIAQFSGGFSFGQGVTSVPDLNGDLKPEFLIAQPYFSSQQASDIGLIKVFSGVDRQLLYTAFGNAAHETIGLQIKRTLDFNSDGFQDLLSLSSVFSNLVGNIYSGMNGNRLGSILNRWEQAAVDLLPDVNSDGVPEIVVGYKTYPLNGFRSGAIEVRSGSNDQLLWGNLGEISTDSNEGATVASLGDINGDSVVDLIVGDPEIGAKGQVRVVSGATLTDIRTHRGELGGDHLGRFGQVSVVGDVNNDGFNDYALSFVPSVSLPSPPARVALFSGLSGTEIWRVSSPQEDIRFGYRLWKIGDINNDGRDDLAVYSLRIFPGQTHYSGVVQMHSGQDGSLLRTFISLASTGCIGFGQFGVRIPDSDGDNKDDFAISCPNAENDAGRIVIVSGESGGIIRTMHGAPNSRLGSMLDIIPDRTGDGVPELLVSAPGNYNQTPGKWLIISPTSGEILRSHDAGNQGSFTNYVSVVEDIDDDGINDYGAANHHLVKIFSGQTGNQLMALSLDGTGLESRASFATMGDRNGDSYIDLAIGITYLQPAVSIRAIGLAAPTPLPTPTPSPTPTASSTPFVNPTPIVIPPSSDSPTPIQTASPNEPDGVLIPEKIKLSVRFQRRGGVIKGIFRFGTFNSSLKRKLKLRDHNCNYELFGSSIKDAPNLFLSSTLANVPAHSGDVEVRLENIPTLRKSRTKTGGLVFGAKLLCPSGTVNSKSVRVRGTPSSRLILKEREWLSRMRIIIQEQVANLPM